MTMRSSDEFVDIELSPVRAERDDVGMHRNLRPSRPSKKSPRRCYLIAICFSISIIASLAGMTAFLIEHPELLGKAHPTQNTTIEDNDNFTPAVITPAPTHIIARVQLPYTNATRMTAQSAAKTQSESQATSTRSGIDPVAIASCLGVLENACAMKNPPTTFGQCDLLFILFYCDLTDMMVFRGAMKPNADGSSPVCQPMKKFCSKAIPLSRIPLADVSP